MHFLPLLVHVETERVAKEWLRAFDAAGIADVESCGVGGCVENDNECRVIKDYLAQPIIKDYLGKLSSFADYVRVREQRQAEREETLQVGAYPSFEWRCMWGNTVSCPFLVYHFSLLTGMCMIT